jgi:hypothetical protein
MIYQRHSDGALVDGFPHRMGADDFRALEAFLDGKTVVPLGAIYADRTIDTSTIDGPSTMLGEIREQLVGMRHDVDHNLEHAVKFARWEAERGWRSTYFVLHSAWYFDGGKTFRDQLRELEQLGHEIGIHNNAVALARDDGPDPQHIRAADILRTAIDTLEWEPGGTLERRVLGAAAHGDVRCDTYGVHNNDMWEEAGGEFLLSQFGLTYEAYFLHKPNWYISDNGGRWEPPLPLEHRPGKQTSMLIHPCHWDIDKETT